MQIQGLDDHVIDSYLKAGKAVGHALALGQKIARPGTNIKDLADILEQDILDRADGWAFPANIGLDHYAAHYSPIIDDPILLPEEGLLKIDLGGHVDGFIADAAVTVNLGKTQGLYADLCSAVIDALYAVIKLAKPGVNVRDLGAVIQTEIEKYPNIRPVSNLGGHGLGQWDLHSAPFVPNVANSGDNYILKEGDQIAIEPFATNGYGAIKNGKDLTIFEVKNIHKKKNLPQIEKLRLQKFKKKFGKLPFSPRWIDFMPQNQINAAILKYYRQGILSGYHVFEERAKGIVSQQEHTLLITKEGAIPTTWWEDFDYHDLWTK